MAFQPDILITTPDGITLVVEAKVILPSLETTEEQLKQYMVSMQCPIGILITPTLMQLYKDSYTARSPRSVQRIGVFDLAGFWQEPPPSEGARFEMFVQQWLEDLPKQPDRQVSSALRDAVREYILPAVTSGEVRAAHPRYSA
jgi:hypothetical protein